MRKTSQSIFPSAEFEQVASRSCIQRLSHQIDLLLACVYSPSLQQLYSAVQDCSDSEIKLWLRYSESKAAVLVHLIISGLEYDQHALHLIEQFARIRHIRGLMLEQKPQLLDGLMKASLTNEKSFERYSPSATSLLTPVLDVDTVLPSSLGEYISTLVQAVSSGSTAYLTQLDSILRHNAAPCLKNVSASQRYLLTSTLANLLADQDTGRVLLTLSCLASLARIDVPDKQRRDSSNTASLFKGDKGQKVVRLVMVAMNSQLSNDDLDKVQHQLDEQDLATHVIGAVEGTALADWLARKDGSSTMKKLMEKLELQMDHGIVRRVCLFLSQISRSTPRGIPGYSTVARRICDRAVQHLVNANFTVELIDTLCSLLQFIERQDASIAIMIRRLLSFAGHKDLILYTWEQRNEAVLYLQLTDALRRTDEVHLSLARALACEEHAELLKSFIELSPDDIGESEEIQILHELHRELSCLILDVQLGDEITTTEKLELRSRKLLVRKLEILSRSIQLPSRCKPRRTTHISLQQAVNTPYSGLGSHAWREKLLDDLQTEAAHQHSRVVSRVDIICRDFERRAEIQEQPLRALEHELITAQQLIEHLESRISEASQELQQRDEETQSAYEERQRLEGAVSELINEVETGNSRVRELEASEAKLNARLQSIEKEFETAKIGAVEQLQGLQHHYTVLECEVTSLKATLEVEETENDRLATDISEKQELLESKHEEVNHLKQQLADTELKLLTSQTEAVIKLEEQNHRLEEIQKSRDEFQNVIKLTSAKLSRTEADLSRITEQCDLLIAKEEDLRNLLEETRSMADERLTLQQENHLSAMSNLKDELLLTNERAAESTRAYEKENTTLRSALSRLKGSYERRCEEFQKAQDLSRRLMAVMSGAATPTTPMTNHTGGPCQTSADSATVTKRHKGKSISASKRIERGFSDGDLTADISLEASDKENFQKMHGNRRSSRREASAILSELSGLGI